MNDCSLFLFLEIAFIFLIKIPKLCHIHVVYPRMCVFFAIRKLCVSNKFNTYDKVKQISELPIASRSVFVL